MLILPYSQDSARDIFKKTSDILKSRGIIAYPTESYYALGVLATDRVALRNLYELKGRPADKPLPIIVGDRTVLNTVVRQVPPVAEDLMRRYWPGPLTMIFEAQETVPEVLTGGQGKVAVRIPGEGIALDLVRSLGVAVTSTSANISGEPPASEVSAIVRYFGSAIDLIIDGGTTPGGDPSTIIDVTVSPPKILRAGRLVL